MRVLIVGAGIVGASLALTLSSRGAHVTVLDRDAAEPRGSTAYAPGFVGVYNDEPVMTELARGSVHAFADFPSFTISGGLELATTAAGATALHDRVARAAAAGVRVELDSGAPLPSFVAEDDITAVAFYPDDATTNPAHLRAEVHRAAVGRGARFVSSAEVRTIDPVAAGWAVRTADGRTFEADQVVLAAGIWGREVASLVGLDVPLFPVAHPYVYAPPAQPVVSPGPFVRWPEHHVYARAHGDTLGLGTYAHTPQLTPTTDLGHGAGLAWNSSFDSAVLEAQRLLRPASRFEPVRRVNGVFSMTPDNLPFIGPDTAHPGIWVAEAIWVTSAGGAAELVADAMIDGSPLPAEFAVDRFATKPEAERRDAALRLYNDIYASL